MIWILTREVSMIALMIALGVYTKKSGIFTIETAQKLSDFLVIVVLPVLLISTLQRDKIPGMMPGFWATMVLAAIIFSFSAAPSSVMFRPGMENYKSARLSVVMPNCGFMGIPLLRAATGDDSVLYCAAILGVFQLLIWCWAIPMLDGSRISLKKILINPGVAAFAVGLAMFLLEIRLPALATSFMLQISGLNTPLSMIMIGVFLADLKPVDVFATRGVLKTVLVRNIAIPAGSVLGMYALETSALYGKIFSMAFVIMISCSSAASALLLPVRAGEGGEFASKSVALSSFCSIVTIPVVAYIAERIL